MNNLYWNGGRKIAHDSNDLFTPENDENPVVGDPQLPDVPTEQILPRIDPETGLFLSGSKSIREEFERIVKTYAVPGQGSAALGKADPAQMPEDDILGNPRGKKPNLGCYQGRESGGKPLHARDPGGGMRF